MVHARKVPDLSQYAENIILQEVFDNAETATCILSVDTCNLS